MLKKLLALVVMLCATLAMAAVDVNKASEADLDAVKGIGPVTSKLIMSERKKGEFKSWQDFIDRVKGVGDVRAAKLSAEGVTIGGAAYRATATSDKKASMDSKPADNSKSATAKTKEAAKDVADKTKEVAGKTVDKTKEVAGKVADKTKEVAKDAKDKVTPDKK